MTFVLSPVSSATRDSLSCYRKIRIYMTELFREIGRQEYFGLRIFN